MNNIKQTKEDQFYTYLGNLGEIVTEYINLNITQRNINIKNFFLSTKYDEGFFNVALYNLESGNTVCKLWPLNEFISLCSNEAKREKEFNNTITTLINRSNGSKYDKIIYI